MAADKSYNNDINRLKKKCAEQKRNEKHIEESFYRKTIICVLFFFVTYSKLF